MGEEEEPGAAGGDDDVAVTAGPSSGASHKESAMSLLLGNDYSAADATDPQLEVDTYVKDSRPSLEINPLDWWRANQMRFPRLARFASPGLLFHQRGFSPLRALWLIDCVPA
ncbi:hypothetical protein DPEC_G00040560 [Dallia pectoralis]|uniref:Uncharacterized protein n=1 Tax=Dallia pectoralis TaxID=75939 RepID=A0ACC2HEN9_DALPE|nr:hypothetical protein DPEC_G00040560 [Dallia pectoralis]